MIKPMPLILLATFVTELGATAPAAAQEMPGMAMPAGPHSHDAAAPMIASPPASPRTPGTMPGMDHDMRSMAMMPAMLDPYAMTREASGTAWQPDSSPMQGLMRGTGGWSGMVQGSATAVYDRQGGARGDSKTFSQSMLMVMGNRAVGARGRIGLRAMLSLDPLMGRRGYPLLFATGETADGRSELVDRQHPHDLLMEVAASYAHDLGGGRAAYLYAGLPGEPALGPPTFMHRLSGVDNPEAPIGHHWFDSTHITFGVVTAGFSTARWKIEASAFKGREPDQHRWDVETPRLDSWSVRAFWNPAANLSLQVSTGHIRSPEQLHPDDNEQRTTASSSYNLPLGDGASWASTIAWSLKDGSHGRPLHAWLGETGLRLDRHILFGRAEHVAEAELFDSGPLAGTIIPVAKLSLGYAYDLPVGGIGRLAIGAIASAYAYPRRIESTYGRSGVKSFMLFARVRLAEPMALVMH